MNQGRKAEKSVLWLRTSCVVCEVDLLKKVVSICFTGDNFCLEISGVVSGSLITDVLLVCKPKN